MPSWLLYRNTTTLLLKCSRSLIGPNLLVRDLVRSIGQNYSENMKVLGNIVLFFNEHQRPPRYYTLVRRKGVNSFPKMFRLILSSNRMLRTFKWLSPWLQEYFIRLTTCLTKQIPGLKVWNNDVLYIYPCTIYLHQEKRNKKTEDLLWYIPRASPVIIQHQSAKLYLYW